MKRFNKQNCTSSVRAQITDKWGRTGTQVDKLNTCNMSVTSYTVTFK